MRPAVLDRALADAGADAVVHAGPPGDPVVSYLAGERMPCRAAVVYGGRVAVVPERALPRHVSVRGDVSVLDAEPVPAKRLPGLVAGSVLAPRTIPHDAALYLENAGVEVASTDALARARSVKTDRERAAIESAQTAAEAGAAAAAGLLAGGESVTGERVRRAANAAVAEAGATPETVVDADGDLAPSDPVRVRVAARADGYWAELARTFVADSDGGFERRATLACEYAVDAALDIVEPGESSADRLAEEATAELGSYGFDPEQATVDVRGVGLERREAPTGEAVVEPGAALAVSVRVSDEETVRVADTAFVSEDDAERVGSFPRSVVPKADY
jgi:Xaa-Pro aminopeptidase